MRTLWIWALLAMCFASPAFAQRPDKDRPMPAPEAMAKRQTQMMRDSLQIDDKQAAKIEAIFLEYGQKMRTLRESEAPQAEKMQEMQVMRTNQDYEIKKCLTKEQAKRYQKIQEAMRARRQERKKD